jgi:hypothetical protein
MTLPVSDKNGCDDECNAAPDIASDAARDFNECAFYIVGTSLPILKSILAKAVIYPIGVFARRF